MSLRLSIACQHSTATVTHSTTIITFVMSFTDSIISQFFAVQFLTRTACDDYARRKYGGPLTIVQPQGRFSYTVAVNNNTIIIQFREKSSPLNSPMEIASMSRLLTRAHGQLCAPFSLVDSLGGQCGNEVEVYWMNKLPGANCSSMTEMLAMKPVALKALIKSLAKYVILYITFHNSFSVHLLLRFVPCLCTMSP